MSAWPRSSWTLRPLPDLGASKIQPPFGSESVRRTCSVPASRSRSSHLSLCNSPHLSPAARLIARLALGFFVGAALAFLALKYLQDKDTVGAFGLLPRSW